MKSIKKSNKTVGLVMALIATMLVSPVAIQTSLAEEQFTKINEKKNILKMIENNDSTRNTLIKEKLSELGIFDHKSIPSADNFIKKSKYVALKNSHNNDKTTEIVKDRPTQREKTNFESDNKVSGKGNTAMIIHDLVNKARAEKGLSLLKYDSQLAMIAEAHSKDMANRNYFSHTSPNGDKPTDRAIDAGYGNCKKSKGSGSYTYGIGENIYKKSGQLGSEEELAHAAFNGWMSSSGHRANILNGNYISEGIGIAIVGNTAYITENFC